MSSPAIPLAAPVPAPVPATPTTPAPKPSTIQKIETDVTKGINLAETWITKIDDKVKKIITAEKAIAPEVGQEIAALVTKTQAFLAAATPAVEGEGLNCGADSVAYSAFVDLVSQFQALAVPVAAVIKAL